MFASFISSLRARATCASLATCSIHHLCACRESVFCFVGEPHGVGVLLLESPEELNGVETPREPGNELDRGIERTEPCDRGDLQLAVTDCTPRSRMLFATS